MDDLKGVWFLGETLGEVLLWMSCQRMCECSEGKRVGREIYSICVLVMLI